MKKQGAGRAALRLVHGIGCGARAPVAEHSRAPRARSAPQPVGWHVAVGTVARRAHPSVSRGAPNARGGGCRWCAPVKPGESSPEKRRMLLDGWNPRARLMSSEQGPSRVSRRRALNLRGGPVMIAVNATTRVRLAALLGRVSDRSWCAGSIGRVPETFEAGVRGARSKVTPLLDFNVWPEPGSSGDQERAGDSSRNPSSTERVRQSEFDRASLTERV